MLKVKLNLTKKDISKKISKNIGFSYSYSEKVTDDLIKIFKNSIKKGKFNIKNFGTFNIINKKEREGRNPKNNIAYKIKARKSLSFLVSKKLNKKINQI